MGKGHWYCKQCEDRKEPESVTFEENCADCGANVVFIETIRGILFSRIQGDYYELTGEKPLLCLKADGDKFKAYGSIEYIEYLENIILKGEDAKEGLKGD
ncbi:hypothetical protein LCGC14_1833090 [marine sediment metagenome]|uniref:Uncharacterized protein n=1 Tax=marine sediment metagenome TaxID=412755 RepID=A0A0F9H3K6_9ZZZZ